MALRIESLAVPRYGYDVGGVLNIVNRPCEVSCGVLHHEQQASRAGELFGKKLRCPKLQREAVTMRRRRRIGCSAAMPSPAITYGPPSLSDYILDRLSTFLLSRGRMLMPESSSSSDLLDWLPPKLHEQIHKSEAFATMLVREGIVFGALGLMYCQVDAFCRGLFRIVSATKRAPLLTDGADYRNSVFHAATAPLRLLITIWASTRMLRIIAFSAQLQQYFGGEIFVRARGIGIVVCSTWFIFRWKQHFIDNYISKHKIDEPRILAFDRLVSLLLYFLSATCIAEIVGFALRSLLAVGGISGIAVGLAAKEVVSNFFGGAVIFLTRPFVIGESIKAGAIAGRVVDIGYMQTKVLGFDGTPLLVPNQSFINQVVTNFSRANSKLLEASFYLHNQDIFKVNQITENVVEYLKTHPQVDSQKSTPMCYLNTMGHWGPEISIMCTINFGGGSFFGVRQEIMVQVAKICVDVLGEEAPFFRNSVTNLMWELRMHLLYAAQEALDVSPTLPCRHAPVCC
ncbi:hypothetical protein M758_10G111600 [Ceratodon purpureus]|nr:hypothetical protein M758_10G111600 [Ceratodon purpureus]